MAKRRLRAKSPGERSRVVGLPSNKVNGVTLMAQNLAAATGPGEVELAVREQLDGNPRAIDRPGEVAAAIRLAKLLDREDHSAMADRLAFKLHVLLKSFAGSRKSRGRLAAIESMANRTQPRQAKVAQQ